MWELGEQGFGPYAGPSESPFPFPDLNFLTFHLELDDSLRPLSS